MSTLVELCKDGGWATLEKMDEDMFVEYDMIHNGFIWKRLNSPIVEVLNNLTEEELFGDDWIPWKRLIRPSAGEVWKNESMKDVVFIVETVGIDGEKVIERVASTHRTLQLLCEEIPEDMNNGENGWIRVYTKEEKKELPL